MFRWHLSPSDAAHVLGLAVAQLVLVILDAACAKLESYIDAEDEC